MYSELAPIELWQWFAFGLLVLALLALDLLVLHRGDRVQSLAESTGYVVFWIALALAFNAFVWWWRGGTIGMQFLAGFLLEKSLSMDNLFVFAVIFRYFQVPLQYQYRVLFWGMLGAIFMRLGFILAGAALIARFQAVLPLFGAFLVYTAYKLARHTASEIDPERNLVLRLGRRWLPMAKKGTATYGHNFFSREDGHLCVMPIFLVLLVIESTDVLFAVDSVPAIFGITQDPFIVFTSNIFAILGLRALYFLLAGVMELFCYLHYGLAAILGFVGLKMIGEWWFAHAEETELIPVWASLLIIATLLGISIFASLLAGRGKENP